MQFKQKLTLRNLFLVLAIVFALIALYFSFAVETGFRGRRDTSVAGGGVDSGADGGACGFAILSGFCFLSAAIVEVGTRKEEGTKTNHGQGLEASRSKRGV